MMSVSSSSSQRWSIWSAGVSFVLFQFFMQLSSGVVIGAIMQSMHLSALMAGLLGSSLYVVYTALQIPVGVLFDRKNTRTLMAINAMICGAGCFVFAFSSNLVGLFAGRFLIGLGSAFAFVGYSHILREHYPLKQFAFLIGLSETLAFIVTVIGMITMGELLSVWGWRNFIIAAGVVGLIISWFCWKNIPDSPALMECPTNYIEQLLDILRNARAWANGLFVGLSFVVVTVFGALWAIPFIQVKLMTSLHHATVFGSMFFLGAGVSCPLFGTLSHRFSKRKPLILYSSLSTTALLLMLLYWPIQQGYVVGLLMFLIGCCCGAYMLAFSIANELAPKQALSTCTGFTNTLAMITAPIFQTLIGYLLDVSNESGPHSIVDYQKALILIPAALLLASALVYFLPEKNYLEEA